MYVAGEVEVYVLHRDHLGITAAGSASLEPEDRTKRRLPKRKRHVHAPEGKGICKSYGHGGLALPGRRRVDRRDQDQTSTLAL